jgi:hypothetical protein
LLTFLVPGDPTGTFAEFAVTQNYFLFPAVIPGGIYVNAGDFNRDGRAEILVGLGNGFPPFVGIFRGDIPDSLIAAFPAFQEMPAFSSSVLPSPPLNHGVSSVAFGGLDQATGNLDVLASTGRGEPALVYSVAVPSLFSTIIFNPLTIPGLGIVLQDGAQIGGVVTAPNSQ